LGPAAETRSLLHLATIEGFRNNNRGLRTFLVGVDIRINAVIAALQAAGVFHPGIGGQKLVLEKLFYQLCNFLLAPMTPVFMFDGPGRPHIKRGTRVIHRPLWLIEHLKTMISGFGYYYYDAPGEAEAELAQLNELGQIDGILTEDSDAFLFGAQLVIRTLGFGFRFIYSFGLPSVQHDSVIYALDSIQNTDTVSLDRAGLLLCALLLGGDYEAGISGVGPTIAHVLARLGFGQDLLNILRSFHGHELDKYLTGWRDALRDELRTNASGLLHKCHPKLATDIPDTFPNLEVINLYLNPLTSASPNYTGPMPNVNLWTPREPSIANLSSLCTSLFGWKGEYLLKKLNSNLWPGVVFRMISSVCIYQPSA
ncbi:PIN domain-like protein, partial [Mycena leptocephala]